MTDVSQRYLLKAFSRQTPDANVDDEVVFSPDFGRDIYFSSRKSLILSLSDWCGRSLYGRHYSSLTELIAVANEVCAAENLADQRTRLGAVIEHARCALRHTVLARLALTTILGFLVLVATMVLAHETHNTHRIYQTYHDNPTVARSPEQSWGYTPVLYDLPEPLKGSLITLDQQVESAFLWLGVGRSVSASSSVRSKKLGIVLLSLFGLLPLAQWTLRQLDFARASREQAFEAAGSHLAFSEANPVSGASTSISDRDFVDC